MFVTALKHLIFLPFIPQALEYHTSCEMKTLYAGDTGRLLLMKGKLTIGKVITFVIEFCFQSSSFVDFQMKVKVKSILFSVSFTSSSLG
jgi:hypothetical protein